MAARASAKAEAALPPPFTSVAVGAGETVGIGADDPATQAWPTVLYRTALARSAPLPQSGRPSLRSDHGLHRGRERWPPLRARPAPAVSAATLGRPAPAAPRRLGRQVLTALALLALAAGAVLGSNASSIRDRLLGSALPAAVAPATGRAAAASASGPLEPTALRSIPWWQTLTTLEGTGSASSVPFTIGPRAIQWRVTGSCAGGHLLARASGLSRPLLDGDCPQAVGTAERRGTTTLDVTASGPWRIEVEQRIDVPLVEARLPATTGPGSSTVATGTFAKVDKVGSGRVSIYSQADGGLSVRLDDFWVTPKSSLQLRLSKAASPRTTREYLAADSQLLAALDVTAGSLNYPAPVGVEPADFRSVVIWSPSDNSVYAAAPLEPPS